MKKLKWGLIGCGDIAQKRVAPALVDLENCYLIAINRRQTDLAQPFAERFNVPRIYETWEELSADDEIEAVYIATPVNLHCQQTIAAAEAGKHILCEKPMALDVAQCQKMIDSCKQNNVKLSIAYYRHFYPAITKIKQILTEGTIGKPVLAQINSFSTFNPPPDHPRHWIIQKEISGGGPMYDFGCHRIEVMLNLFGTPEATKSMLSNNFLQRQVEDTCTALLSFPGGPQGVINVTHAAMEPQDTLDLFCTEGAVHIPNLNKGTVKIITSDGTENLDIPPHPNLHQPLIDDFTRAVLDDRAPVVTGEIGLAVNQALHEICNHQ